MVLSSGRLESSGSDRPENDKTNLVGHGLQQRVHRGPAGREGVGRVRKGFLEEVMLKLSLGHPTRHSSNQQSAAIY